MKYLKYFNEGITTYSPDTFSKNVSASVSSRNKFINAMNIMTLDEAVDYVIEHCKEFLENPIVISRYDIKKFFKKLGEKIGKNITLNYDSNTIKYEYN